MNKQQAPRIQELIKAVQEYAKLADETHVSFMRNDSPENTDVTITFNFRKATV